MNWLQAVEEHFPRDSRVDLPRPVLHMFISEQHKILYSPVAKCACTSLKRLMVDLSGVEHHDIIVKYDVHRVTSNFNTGTRLKDHAPETISRVLNSDEYYKFAVIREPISRTISAYTEKFFVNRNTAGNLLHTIDPIRSVRRQSSVDTHQGISFREFVNYLVESNAFDLDPHWGPQHYNLGGVDRYNDVFCIEQLDQLAVRLTERTGQNISLGKHNTSLDRETSLPTSIPGRYADMLPADLDGAGKLSPSDFMAPDLVAKLENYFSEDLALYKAAREGLSDYQPQQPDWDSSGHPGATSAVTDIAVIARSLTLYSKGFFTLDTSGRGLLQVLIINAKQRPLDLDSAGSCYLAYCLRDSAGNLIHSTQTQSLVMNSLEAKGQQWETVEISVPPELIDKTNTVTVSMQFGDSFQVEALSALHITCAQLLRGA